MTSSKEFIKDIAINGTPAEKRELFGFNGDDEVPKIIKKFKLFIRSNYPRYFEASDSPEHDITIKNYINSYLKDKNALELAYRGYAKTTISKLFITFAMLNDKDQSRKYIKVISKDYSNSRQIVTDIYNLIVELIYIYGDVFEKEGKKKQEETMGVFTVKGTKLRAGTVGQIQRGHVQDAYRPDWVLFEDVEDSESISSITITEKVILRCQEAIDGLSFEGNYIVNGNYISDSGVIEWFKKKPSINLHIVPIATDIKIKKNIILEATPTWDRYSLEKIQEIYDEADDFWGEYMCDPERVGDKFFDTEMLRKDIREHAREPERVSGGVRYWGSYKPNHRYGEGMDLSDGVGLDSCALSLFDFTTGELLVSYDDNETSPDLFAYEGARVGEEFGNCVIAPEINNTCGGVAISILKEKEYPNIYQRKIKDRLEEKETTKLGWKTDSRTKPNMFYDFRRDYNEGVIKIYDVRVLKEMKAFTKRDLKHSTGKGLITRHFDLLTSIVIAYQMKGEAEYSGTDFNTFPAKQMLK